MKDPCDIPVPYNSFVSESELEPHCPLSSILLSEVNKVPDFKLNKPTYAWILDNGSRQEELAIYTASDGASMSTYKELMDTRDDPSLRQEMEKLVAADERLTRSIFAMLIMREFEKSFAEFQKVMGESNGQPTPQSNFIVQNEITKMAGLLRFSRAHAHNTDNETLDLLDDVNKVIEMTEGRRDRRDNKSFQEIFNDINRRLSDHVAKLEPQWKEIYEKLFKEMVEISQKKETEQKQA